MMDQKRELTIDDQFLDQFVEKIRSRASDNQCGVSVSDVDKVTRAAKIVLAKEKALIDIEPPINVCGDIHGNLNGLLCLLNLVGWPPKYRYLFLGDYVDRGMRGVEVMCLLLALKTRYPNCVYLLRGNHEEKGMNIFFEMDGFKHECIQRYCPQVWYMITGVFPYLPLCAVIGGRIMCMHGGIPRYLTSLDTIRQLPRPTHGIPNKGFVCDLLWADPSDQTQEFGSNMRGISHVFGEKALAEFCERVKIDMVIRAHEVAEDGVEKFGDRLITVFSSPSYCGRNNSAGMVYVDNDFQLHLKEFKPMSACEALRSLLVSFNKHLQDRRLVVKKWPQLDANLKCCENEKVQNFKQRIEYCNDESEDKVELALDVSIEESQRILVAMVQPKVTESIEWSNVAVWNEGAQLWTLLMKAKGINDEETVM